MTALRCVNHPDTTAAAVTVHGHDQIGKALCAACTQCTDLRCDEPGTILDADQDQPWCAYHAGRCTGEETIYGPELVAIGSERHRALTSSGGA
ncbi:hypothetical protein JOD54_001951 [Actinokineospora baliensis]|uniref:hypothetical protein n=1 Tax=Actinokineospora baliensis TaxID=547056 RepID=UPI00195E5995|nr:hypothetical protein [Actinokineospora baliensis]MBM7771747.1 hypothetical protein [Actinokineospora baliensis]